MKAIVFDTPGDAGVLHLGTAPAPELQPGSVRIKVFATAVNRADIMQRRGLYPPPKGASSILGLECAGEVMECGADAGPWRPGQRVMALLAGGGYAEEVVVDRGSVMAIPEGMGFEQAAAFPEAILTAFSNIFQLGEPPEGGAVLVHGGGSGVGTAAIALCREAKITCVVTAGSAVKCQRCLDLGATHAINYRDENFADATLKHVPGGVNAVLDCIGAPYLDDNLKVLAFGGRLINIGLMGGNTGSINMRPLLSKNLRVIGSTLRGRSVQDKARVVTGFVQRFGAALNAGRLHPIVDQVLPLQEAAAAHKRMESSEHFGKLVLQVRK